jgi:hypothetical protein
VTPLRTPLRTPVPTPERTPLRSVCAPVAAAAASVAAVRTDVPVQPSREQARAWALEELAKRDYEGARPGLLQRALTWAFDQFGRIGDAGRGVSITLLALAAAVIVALVGYGLYRAGGIGRTARRSGVPALDDPTATAADHRAAAERYAAEGNWDAAVLHRFRAIARTLEDEAVLAPQPGRTADEIAHEAGFRIPQLAADLGSAARTFDDVRYGDRHVDAGADERMRAVDDAVRRARVAAAP